MQNSTAFLEAYRKVWVEGELVVTRGSSCIEVRNMSIDIDPVYPITSFAARKLNLSYAKKEVLWYLRGNRFDKSICEVAGAWNTLVQPDGGINSNYGQDIFEGPRLFDWVIEELSRDIHSRRAVMPIGRADMLSKDNSDHRCTMYIAYAIRKNTLHQTVHMRSNDIIYGLTNDVFFFGLLHQMVWVKLKAIYPSLGIGVYTHCADSMHVYEKHHDMIDKIVTEGMDGWYDVDPPVFLTGDEVDRLRFNQSNNDNLYGMPAWLLEN